MDKIIMILLVSMLVVLLVAAFLVLIKLAQLMKWEREERRKNHGRTHT